MKISILGNGGFGTAMSIVLHRAGHDVGLWGFEADLTAEMARTRTNPVYLDGVTVPDGVLVTSDAEQVLDGAEVVLVSTPTQHVRGALTSMASLVPPAVPVVSLAKGLEQASGKRPSEVVVDVLGGEDRVYALCGPSHAEEVARLLPTTVVLAGPRDDVLVELQAALSSQTFRVYRNDDLMGLELCGALKNVMALAAGMADGLGYGDNSKAAILGRGIVEMARYGVAFGAQERTFYGLAGVGDLAVTAFSRHGRNRAFGERIGRGATLQEALAASRKVAEGVWTSRVVVDEAARKGIEMPIATAVARILFEDLPPQQAVHALMERDVKSEG